MPSEAASPARTASAFAAAGGAALAAFAACGSIACAPAGDDLGRDVGSNRLLGSHWDARRKRSSWPIGRGVEALYHWMVLSAPSIRESGAPAGRGSHPFGPGFPPGDRPNGGRES